MKKLLLMACLVALVSCTSIEVLAPPVDNLFIAQADISSKEAAQLRQGREIYLKFCTRCHGAVQVDEITEENWKEHIPKMLKKAKLYPEEIVPLKAYLKTAGPINQRLIIERETQKK